MGELINLRRVKKAARRVAKEQLAAANRAEHGTSKHLRKSGKAEKERADQTIEAHRLDTKDKG
jgi:Domain of unknown function (DUF4169)